MGAVKSYPSRELTRLRREWVQSKQRYVVLMAAFYVAVSIALQSADLDHVVLPAKAEWWCSTRSSAPM